MRLDRYLTIILCLTALSLLAYIYSCSGSNNTAATGINPGNPSFSASSPLSADDVRNIIRQAVSKAAELNVNITVSVVDRGGNVLGVFRMDGAPTTTLIGSQNPDNILDVPEDERGLELVGLDPIPMLDLAALASISKAGTAAFLSTSGNAFTPLTASDIIQEHRPVGINFVPGGPLFGVQFSSLPCGDIKNNPPLPLGLAGDPGGLPLYKNGEPVGGIGVEGVLETVVIDGQETITARYSVDPDPFDFGNVSLEETIALAGVIGFEAPAGIKADTILLDGFRLPYSKNSSTQIEQLLTFDELPGETIEVSVPAFTFFDGNIKGTPDPSFGFQASTLRGINGRISVDQMGNNRFPFIGSDSGGLSAQEVETILGQAMEQAIKTRAAIRQPAGSFAEVNITVVDENGEVLGYFGTPDAPFFGFDVSVQKARTAAFFSNARARQDLIDAGLNQFVQNAANDGLQLDGSIAFSDRGAGFLNRPFFPDGIDGTDPGPFSRDISIWSPFNDGLQLEIVKGALLDILTGGPLQSCSVIEGLDNGIQIFAGSVPLYKDGVLIGGIGVSGDGIDQDDLVAVAGSEGFESPPEIRSDTVFVRGVRLPFVKFPRNAELR